jgi:hypothetical protein
MADSGVDRTMRPCPRLFARTCASLGQRGMVHTVPAVRPVWTSASVQAPGVAEPGVRGASSFTPRRQADTPPALIPAGVSHAAVTLAVCRPKASVPTCVRAVSYKRIAEVVFPVRIALASPGCVSVGVISA